MKKKNFVNSKALPEFSLWKKIENDSVFSLIKGDNSPHRSFEISPRENILGRVTNIERHGKNVFIGIGPERRLIVLLNRIGLLRILFLPWRFVNKRLDRKS